MYNDTNLTNAQNIYDTTLALNQLSGGLIGIFFLGIVFIITFIIFKKYDKDTKEVLVFDSLITLIIGVLLWAIKLIGFKILIFPFVVMIASILVYKFTD